MGFLDKWTKKATTTAIETAKESINNKFDTYIALAKIGVTFGVIAFGAKHISSSKHIPQPDQNQQPIIINNYITDGRYDYGRQNKNRQGYKGGR